MIDGDTRPIVARYGPSHWQLNHLCTVRGVRVDKFLFVPADPGYVWCRFPDERIMLVSEKNVRAKAVSRKEFMYVPTA